MSKKTVYEPHPVSPERKAELRAQGYKIIDAQFAPKGYASRSTSEEIAEAIAAQGEGQDETTKPLTIPQIKAALAAKEVEIPAGVTKQAELLALLDGASGA